MKSIFTEKEIIPQNEDVETGLGTTYNLWQMLKAYVQEKYPTVIEEWNYSKSAGWILRLSDKKRVIIYLMPRAQFFKVAMVFGQKATDKIMESTVEEGIKKELAAAKPYMEGRGIRIEIKGSAIIGDIEKLIDIKLQN